MSVRGPPHSDDRVMGPPITRRTKKFSHNFIENHFPEKPHHKKLWAFVAKLAMLGFWFKSNGTMFKVLYHMDFHIPNAFTFKIDTYIDV